MIDLKLEIPKISISKVAVVHTLLCIAVLALFVVLLIIPGEERIDTLQQEIVDTEIELERQRQFLPLYIELKRQEKKKLTSLPQRKKTPLSPDEINSVSNYIFELANKSGLEVLMVTPDVNSMRAGIDLLLVECVLQGEFSHLSEFYKLVATLPAFEKIGQIEAVETFGVMEYHFRVWFALKQGSE